MVKYQRWTHGIRNVRKKKINKYTFFFLFCCFSGVDPLFFPFFLFRSLFSSFRYSLMDCEFVTYLVRGRVRYVVKFSRAPTSAKGKKKKERGRERGRGRGRGERGTTVSKWSINVDETTSRHTKTPSEKEKRVGTRYNRSN